MSVIRVASTVHSCLRSASLLAAVALTASLTTPASADDYDAAIKDIQSTMGGVPSFVKQFPKAGLPGAWAEVKAIELSDKTALSPKVKSLISLAVAAQIPCSYCVWSDTENAKRAGATDEEIQEAVAMAALTRHWSTIFNGMQVDMAQFKKDMGGE
ncbi:carboxymuconolactone decarboxylase family protein [Mesorhizobium sp. M1C.F.Ca.ET.193.01.1.1]|uniref:carboxymuconolactone decarboxylase family protein n=1 Tax=unclassified Mesorhizobium TaxID=325217 RepID=UPI000FD49946|nr:MULTISPECIES: carboxymuconolactone decarboxylase family protein [unclassified Mesorhizobium]TGS95635.1 carboxymuconolactone decarboxylase family protein [bacterium M00.F.Ca.ET.177.01.1.1]TGQ51707.1 carboxymuconolactone decarboxylase family protein [Mesorhizobium sp. M1C.F.Ca.ET.210.01.1.1]TGQ67942.1 carboxymuconolactone decarboxylase family protein [Mesorhizobium sp. M1C.F.Ca.ET.212.01.1.1]TGR03026.1 carboxymuconolactone decarboxylase family protein [Mesorhizobium sp. M1C.F.Ca.ET.204.01.1.1]